MPHVKWGSPTSATLASSAPTLRSEEAGDKRARNLDTGLLPSNLETPPPPADGRTRQTRRRARPRACATPGGGLSTSSGRRTTAPPTPARHDNVTIHECITQMLKAARILVRQTGRLPSPKLTARAIRGRFWVMFNPPYGPTIFFLMLIIERAPPVFLM